MHNLLPDALHLYRWVGYELKAQTPWSKLGLGTWLKHNGGIKWDRDLSNCPFPGSSLFRTKPAIFALAIQILMIRITSFCNSQNANHIHIKQPGMHCGPLTL